MPLPFQGVQLDHPGMFQSLVVSRSSNGLTGHQPKHNMYITHRGHPRGVTTGFMMRLNVKYLIIVPFKTLMLFLDIINNNYSQPFIQVEEHSHLFQHIKPLLEKQISCYVLMFWVMIYVSRCEPACNFTNFIYNAIQYWMQHKPLEYSSRLWWLWQSPLPIQMSKSYLKRQF